MFTKHLGFLLNIIAIGLFVPGVLMPMFSLNMEMMAHLGQSGLTSSLVNKELSLYTTITELWNDERILVASLIFVFSIAIPIIKSILVSIAYLKRNTQLEHKLLSFVGAIGKWSMADVFVIAVFLAVLSTNHADTSDVQEFIVFGFKISLDISTQTLSQVKDGFYYFTGYCLLSLIAVQISQFSLSKKA